MRFIFSYSLGLQGSYRLTDLYKVAKHFAGKYDQSELRLSPIWSAQNTGRRAPQTAFAIFNTPFLRPNGQTSNHRFVHLRNIKYNQLKPCILRIA